jgi:uncharacterized membrane protein YjdF
MTALLIGIVTGVSQILESKSTGDILISFSLLVVVFMPNILRKIGLQVTPMMELLYLIFVFFAQIFGSIFDFYQLFYFYDKLVHFISGILTSFIGIYIVVKFKKNVHKNITFNCIMIIFTVMAIAGFWEFFEFISTSVFGGDPQKVITTGVGDTMGDMLSALFGSLFMSLIYIYEEINNKKIIMTKFINEISK